MYQSNSINHRAFRGSQHLSTAIAEALEDRRLMSAGTLRIATYNINADTSSFAGNDQRTGMETILEGMGIAHLNDNGVSNSQPFDLLALQELQNGSGGTNAPTLPSIVAALNAHYGAGTYAFDPTLDPTSGGTTGNGPSGLIYNTTTVQIINATALSAASGGGAPRAPMQYKVQPVGFSSDNQFYLDVSHMKSGTDSIARRNIEAQTLVGNVPDGTHVISVGDFNITSGSSEATYQTMLGKFIDVAIPSEVWSDASTAQARAISGLLSFSPTSARFRDDIQLVTPSADPSSASATSGLQYLAGSSVVFGNGGASSLEGNAVTNTTANPGVFSDLTATQRSAILSAETTTSDHLPVVADYKIVASVPPPMIASFAVNPTSAPSGANVTLSASGVTDTSGTVTSVKFYRESNSTSNLQIGSDTFLGSGTLNGSTWSIVVSTGGLNAGSATYYAVASDNSGLNSPTAMTVLSVTSVPHIASLSINPSPVISGASVSLTANTVTDAGSTASAVGFYRESNNTPGLQTGTGGDTLLGTGTQSGINWTLNGVSTASQLAGSYTYYAVATDPTGSTSTAVPATLAVTAGQPMIGTFSASPTSIATGGMFTLTADGVTEAGGTITAVNFYRESAGGAGLQIGSDTFVGNASSSGSTWSLSGISASGLNPAAYTFYAVATDGTNGSSSASVTSLTVTPPPAAFFNISILGSTSPNGPFSSSLQVSTGQTIYYEVVGQMAAVGTSNGTRTINSLTSHPASTPTPTGYDGASSLAFDLSDIGDFTGSFASAALATNAATGDDWSRGASASSGTVSGANLLEVRPIQTPGVFAAALSAEQIIAGSFVVPAIVAAGQTSQINGKWSSSTIGSLAINSTSTTGLSSTKVAIAAGDPNALVNFSGLTLRTGSSLPSWLAQNSAAAWNPSTNTLTVTGPTSIIADPAGDEPEIIADGSSAQISVSVGTVGEDVHLGGVDLTNGARLDVASVGSSRSHNNHSVIVLGALNGAAPLFSVDQISTFDLGDNDLVVHSGSLSTVQTLAARGRNVAPGGVFDGTWDGKGLTSSAAAAVDLAAGYERNVLAVVKNSDLFLGSLNKWQVGSSSENLGANDVIVKYTYNGDLTLSGSVDADADTVFSTFYDGGVSVQNLYAFGDLNGDGKVDATDDTIFSSVFGAGTGGTFGELL